MVLATEKKLNSNGESFSWPLKKKLRGKSASIKLISALCALSFLVGIFISSQPLKRLRNPEDCDPTRKSTRQSSGGVVSTSRVSTLHKSTSSWEMDPDEARKLSEQVTTPLTDSKAAQKVFAVIGINTAFSGQRRRDSLRDTWMLKGDKLRRLEKDKGVVLRFVIGHSAAALGALDKAINAEEAKYRDILRLNHVEGYHQLSTKTRLFFSTAVSLWDAEFYVKVDDDVHVNLGALISNLVKHRSKPRTYIGCMKSGPVLSQKGERYHEPEYWKFGDEGNKYFRHATGQIYAISKDLATYISTNYDILHLFANEDVSLGSWFIGLEVEHVDDPSMCCKTPPECQIKAGEGKVCGATFDWECSGICKSVDRMKQVHADCGESESAIWNVDLSTKPRS